MKKIQLKNIFVFAKLKNKLIKFFKFTNLNKNKIKQQLTLYNHLEFDLKFNFFICGSPIGAIDFFLPFNR